MEFVYYQIRFIILFLAASFYLTCTAQAQTGKLQGKVTDAATKEEVPLAKIFAKKKGSHKVHTQASINGQYVFTSLNPGTYIMKVSRKGYNTKIISWVLVLGGQTRFVNLELTNTGGKAPIVEKVPYKNHIIDYSNTSTSQCGSIRNK